MIPTPRRGANVSRPLLTLSFGLLALGLFAAVTGGLRTGAFWTYLIATNLTALLARLPDSRWRRGGYGLALAVFVAGLYVHTAPGRDTFVDLCRTSPAAGARLFLGLGGDVDGTGRVERRTPLTAAVEFHRTDTARLLLDAGADPNRVDAYGWTPLMVARYLNRDDLANLLRARGAQERPLPVLPHSAHHAQAHLPTAHLAFP